MGYNIPADHHTGGPISPSQQKGTTGDAANHSPQGVREEAMASVTLLEQASKDALLDSLAILISAAPFDASTADSAELILHRRALRVVNEHARNKLDDLRDELAPFDIN